MEKNKFYTGFGDKGYTQTLKNMRIPKSDSLIELLGTLDEFTSTLGVAKVNVRDKEIIDDIEVVQRKIIEVNCEIAGGKISVTKDCITSIENMIDKYQAKIGEFKEFILPGGNLASASLDVARTVARRAERMAVKVGQFGRIQGLTLVYINRLSDLMYAFARYSDNTDNKIKTEAVRVQMNDNILPQNKLTLALAKEIAHAVEENAKSMGLSVVIAILDEGANLMLLHSMDNAYIASCQIAQDKAYTAVSLKMPTQIALELSRGGALDGLASTSQNRMMLLGGGVPLIVGGRIIGSLGVSGGTAQQDISFAEYGARYIEGRLR